MHRRRKLRVSRFTLAQQQAACRPAAGRSLGVRKSICVRHAARSNKWTAAKRIKSHHLFARALPQHNHESASSPFALSLSLARSLARSLGDIFTSSLFRKNRMRVPWKCLQLDSK
jgi:hypothetical protein